MSLTSEDWLHERSVVMLTGSVPGKSLHSSDTHVSAYFFDHLVGDLNSGEWSEAVARRELHTNYTPNAYKTLARDILKEEERRTDTLREELQRAWAVVEDVMACNAERQQRVAQDRLANGLEGMGKLSFWSADDVYRRVEGGGAQRSGNTQRSSAAQSEKADGNVDIESVFSDAIPGAVPASVGNVPSMFADGSINPDARPIRSLFAPLLQRREQLPRHLTLLLNELADLQKNHLPRVEERLQPDDVALVRAFERLATFMQRQLAKQPPAEEIEQRFVRSYEEAEEVVASEWQRVTQQMSTEGSRADVDLQVASMWRLLDTELQLRSAVHEGAAAALEETILVGDADLKAMADGVEASDSGTQDLVRSVAEFVDKAADRVRETTSRLSAAADRCDAEFNEEHTVLQARVDDCEYRLQRSAAAQEKHARAAREALKELGREQARYEVTCREMLEAKLRLAQVEESHKQLQRFISMAKKAVVAKASPLLQKRDTDVLEDGNEVRGRLSRQCRLHISRCRTEEHFRRVRVVDVATQNATQWSRALNDIMSLLAERYNEQVERSKESWQVNFMLRDDHQKCVAALQRGRLEAQRLDKCWATIREWRTAYDIPEVSIDVHEKDAATHEMRRLLHAADASRKSGVWYAVFPITESSSSPNRIGCGTAAQDSVSVTSDAGNATGEWRDDVSRTVTYNESNASETPPEKHLKTLKEIFSIHASGTPMMDRYMTTTGAPENEGGSCSGHHDSRSGSTSSSGTGTSSGSARSERRSGSDNGSVGAISGTFPSDEVKHD